MALDMQVQTLQMETLYITCLTEKQLLMYMVMPVNLLLENVVQDRIGHAQYGIYAALNALAFLFIVVVDLGLNQFLTKKFASETTIDPHKLSTYFSFKLVLALLYPFIMVTIG